MSPNAQDGICDTAKVHVSSSLTADAFQAGNRRMMEMQSPLWLSQGCQSGPFQKVVHGQFPRNLGWQVRVQLKGWKTNKQTKRTLSREGDAYRLSGQGAPVHCYQAQQHQQHDPATAHHHAELARASLGPLIQVPAWGSSLRAPPSTTPPCPCLLSPSPSPRDVEDARVPASA